MIWQRYPSSETTLVPVSSSIHQGSGAPCRGPVVRPAALHRAGAYPGVLGAPGPRGIDRGQVEGAPPNNAFDPTRPFGGQSAITAPPGTAAFEEQANERRYFCEYAPEHC